MAREKRRRWPTKKYQISSTQRGAMRFDDAWDAREAARVATRRAREGYKVEVQTYSGTGWVAGRKSVKMTCEPAVSRTGKPITKCQINPAFKKKIRGF